MADATVNEAAVVKQITFYFGDSNLTTDKHLQKKVAEDAEGWVKLDHIASFKRMQSLVPSSDVAVIGNILKSSDQDTVEVDEDNTKVRRNPAKPLPEENLFNKRAIYTKGWDLKETTIDSVETYFTGKGYKVLQVRLRRLPVTKDFKGSVFVELSDVDEATKCAAETHKVGEETELLVEMKSAYHQRKNAERLAKRKAKAAAKKDKADAGGTDGASATKKEDAAPAEEEVYELGCVLKFEGLADDTTRENIKEKLNPIQEVKWVDFQRGDTGGEVRFEEAGSATKVKAKADEDKVEINGKVPTWTVLEGEDEKTYYKKMSDARKARRSAFSKSKRGGRGGGRGRGRGRGGGRGNKRKAGGDDGPKAKRSRDD
jgi:lupus La protein